MFCFDGDPHLSHIHHSVECLGATTASLYGIGGGPMEWIFLQTRALQELRSLHVTATRSVFRVEIVALRSHSVSVLSVVFNLLVVVYIHVIFTYFLSIP